MLLKRWLKFTVTNIIKINGMNLLLFQLYYIFVYAFSYIFVKKKTL